MSAVAVTAGRQIRAASFTVVLCVTLAAAAVSWARVVDRLRSAEPLEATGTVSAIVWSNRVFRSEGELARWLRARGVDYERWVKRHPAAVATLRSKGAPRPRPAASPAERPNRAAAQRRRASSESRVTATGLAVPAAMTFALLMATVAMLPARLIRRVGGTGVGRLLGAARSHRAVLVLSALSWVVAGLLLEAAL